MTTIKLFFRAALLIIIISSCKENKELSVARDPDYFEPPLRIDKRVKDRVCYKLYERYFVYGYNKNKEKFDSLAVDLLCKKMNEKELLSRLDIVFEDCGTYATYREGEIPSAAFTRTIVSLVWDMENPNIIKSEWIENDETRMIPFPCVLRKEYDFIKFE
ncbi:MAG: hypothetical protein KIPDCIKN_04406 [Haliscomenobacter sp.]|jgi:hypothetical protein|nr:hypothetical protein [Haliscomenobacter sp.]